MTQNCNLSRQSLIFPNSLGCCQSQEKESSGSRIGERTCLTPHKTMSTIHGGTVAIGLHTLCPQVQMTSRKTV
ncbi:hypothetical protein E2C01_054244 [Portunus trituberculatus]|uniref:Uncharacterized protein n=1 Tax=Portunus trituberculatus TaxID=210409 RepID=A0A5B7GS89_PORTR|nr:hypothetical protein [Portunus trituberculatus]